MHLALAPKSNRVTAALGAAQRDVREGPHTDVPAHLRGTGYSGAASLGHGDGYRYPHDDPRGWVDQQYLPDELRRHAVLVGVAARRGAGARRVAPRRASGADDER